MFRYGGQYSDLDTVTLLSSNYLENVVAWAGDFISNANLIFKPGHPGLWKLMKEVNQRFNGKGWNSIGEFGSRLIIQLIKYPSGPVLLTDTIRKLCRFGNSQGRLVREHETSCFNISIHNHLSFFPLKPGERRLLFASFPPEYWRLELLIKIPNI